MLRSQKGPRLPSPVGGKPHGLGLGWGGVLQGDEQPPPEHPTWGVALLWPLGHHLELCLFHHLPEDRVGGWWSTASPEVGRTQSRGSVLKDEDMNPLQISKKQRGFRRHSRGSQHPIFLLEDNFWAGLPPNPHCHVLLASPLPDWLLHQPSRCPRPGARCPLACPLASGRVHSTSAPRAGHAGPSPLSPRIQLWRRGPTKGVFSKVRRMPGFASSVLLTSQLSLSSVFAALMKRARALC